MDTIVIVVVICLVAMIAVSWALLAPRSPVRRAINAWATGSLERDRAAEVYRTAYDFTVAMPAQQVIDAIEQRWGRAIPTDEPQFYVHSAIYEQQVILRFGNAARPKYFAARIDFESRESASGTLWFYEAEDLDLVGAADQLRIDLNGLLKELSPGSSLRVRDEELVITTMEDKNYEQRKPGQHRRRKP